MGIVSGIVLYAVIWFMVLFVMLPFGLKTQGEVGRIVPGTPPGAPSDVHMRKVAWRVTVWSAGIWVLIAAVIFSGVISLSDFDLMKRFGPDDFRPVGTGG